MTIIDYSKTYKYKLMKMVWINIALSALFLMAYTFTNNFLKNDWLALSLTFFGVALVYAAGVYLHYQKPYITLHEGELKIHGVKSQNVQLQDIQNAKSFAGDLIIYTPVKRIIIEELKIDPETLGKLKNKLNPNL